MHGSDLKLDYSPNAQWHAKHRLPDNQTIDQRIKYHIEHARRCPCSLCDVDILPQLRQRYFGKHQDFWIEHNCNDQRELGFWAAECAEHVLPYFEEKYGYDTRPRDAIRTLREWVKTGKFSMDVIRRASLSAHAAAKTVQKKDVTAAHAAHAAGQAVGSAHVPTHAIGTILYSIKITAVLNSANIKTAVNKQREWQNTRLSKNLKLWVDTWLERTIPLLPKSLRGQLV